MATAGRPNLQLRLLSAIVGLPLLALILWAGGPWVAGAAAIAALIASNELLTLQGQAGWQPPFVRGAALWGGIVVALAIVDGLLTLAALAAGALVLGLSAIVARGPGGAWRGWSLATLGVCYVALSLAALVLTRLGDAGLQWVLLAFLATFATDTSAYVVGKAIGRHKLVPSISPGKTWEGSIGGLAGAVGATIGLVYLLDGIESRVWLAVGLGVGIGVVSQAGDLLESKMKRLANVKDSGRLIPGHGGLLDRLDSLVPVFPLVYYASLAW